MSSKGRTIKRFLITQEVLSRGRFAMDKKLLLQISNKEPEVKEVCVIKNPQRMQAVLGKMSWKILTALSEQEMYPLQLAKHLGIHEQLVYYYIRRLAKAGVITVQREENRKGAVAKYYRAVSSAFAVELPDGYKPLRSQPSLVSVDKQVQRFFHEFITENGYFDGKVVVGCPTPHGPFKTSARDGHYAAALTFFLGQFVRNPVEFAIKLDTDVKAEKEEKNNLVLVGGPGTNLLTQEINEYLPVRFNMQSSNEGFLLGGMVSQRTQRTFTSDTAGLVAKIVNPWDETKRIIVVAGNKAVGTKACVLALTNFWNKTLKNYHDGEPFAAVIQGFDMDGDGKVDAIEVPE
jgi:DNA-binding transcriptional ArsR family regulator